MAKKNYPTYNITDLWANRLPNDILNVDHFKEYLLSNPHLHTIHRHSFYHLVYFTKGRGSQVIDFVKFPVQPGMIYFMNPSQVHKWEFEGVVDGFIINFSATFFEQLHLNSQLLNLFPFFNGDLDKQVFVLSKKTGKEATALFEKIITEQKERRPGADLMIASVLIQLFLTVQRDVILENSIPKTDDHNATTIRNFKELVEDNFHKLRLPKEYAALLYLTPSHLNAICKEVLGIPAGEVIRNRMVLEAKRLLVNFDLSVSNIAAQLNYQDTSYFVRSFKKYTGITPELFRKQEYGR